MSYVLWLVAFVLVPVLVPVALPVTVVFPLVLPVGVVPVSVGSAPAEETVAVLRLNVLSEPVTVVC